MMSVGRRGQRILLLLVALGIHLAFLVLLQTGMMRFDFLATDRKERDRFKEEPQLYVYVSGWMEGMSSWMISLSEMLVLSKELNATFVEPCITNGNLCSCANRGSNPLQLSHILDMDKIREYYPAIVSYDEFAQRTGSEQDMVDGSWIRICMHHFSPRPRCEEAPLVYGAKNIPQVYDAIWSATHQTTVLEIKRYGRYGFKKLEWVSDEEAAYVKQTFLRLAPRNFAQADRLLRRMGIGRDEPFSVIHWRAEIPGIDYMRCAKRIAEARDALAVNHSVILMSSLNTHADFAWAGAKNLAENTTSDKALQSLSNAGFLKLDQVIDYDNLTDPIMLAVYDLVLAMRATEFVTCTKECSDDSICAACNWRGHFAGLAVSLRSEVAQKTSVQCWPDSKNLANGSMITSPDYPAGASLKVRLTGI